MKTNRFTAAMLEYRIKRCMNQEKRALSLGDWNEADWCRTAAREWRRRLEIAKTQGYWEHEYEPITDKEYSKLGPRQLDEIADDQ